MTSKSLLHIFLLLLGVNSQFLRFLHPPKEPFNYSSYSSVSTDENLEGKTLTSTAADQNVVYITKSGIVITNSNLNKESGNNTKARNRELSGVNSALLVNGGNLTMTGGTITTKIEEANALVVTNNGSIKITDTEITSTGSKSAIGIHSTFKGKVEANNIKITTQGNSSAALSTGRGEGSIICTGCNLTTNGYESPLINSKGNITISKTEGTATQSQAIVMKGKSEVTLEDSSYLKCNSLSHKKNKTHCAVKIHQSKPGDEHFGGSKFNCSNSTIEILETSSVYSTAPMFYVTNTKTQINLEECEFKYGSNIFLNIKGKSEFEHPSPNGGEVVLNLTNQTIEGDFIVDNKYRLTINLINSAIKGKINANNTAAKLVINLDKNSNITLTGNSYYTSLINEKTDGSNLINGSYNWTSVPEKEIKMPPKDGKPGSPRGPPPGNRTEGMPPFNGTKPHHNKTAPFNSTKPPHDDKPPFDPFKPPCDSSHPPPENPKAPGNNSTQKNQTTDPSPNAFSNKNNNNKNNTNIEDEDDDMSYDDIQQYVKNGGAKLNNYYYLTLILILTIIS